MPSFPSGVGLMIGIPHDGKSLQGLEYAFHFAQFHPPMNYEVRYGVLQGKPVDEARNLIAEEAVKANCKYLFFNDTDVTIPPHTIRQLIFHLEHFPKYAVIGGIYVHKAPPQFPMVFRGNGQGSYWDWKKGEVFQVSGIGMGATMIRVAALKDVEKPWFKTVDDVTPWMDAVPQASMWTEDLWFCDRVEKAGWKIAADGGLLCTHWDWPSHTAYNLPSTSKPLQNPHVPKGSKKIVDLGSGPLEDSYNTSEGTVIRVDVREDVQPDYRCDIRNTPFETGSIDVVFSSHTLEHFARCDVEKVVDEMIRIMKPDGELRLLLPNLKWAAQHIMNGEVDMHVMNVLYGAQSYEENFHKVGFTPEMIEQLLRQKGFVHFVWDFHLYNMFVRAWRKIPKEVELMNPTLTMQGMGSRFAKDVETEKAPEDVDDPKEIFDEDGIEKENENEDAKVVCVSTCNLLDHPGPVLVGSPELCGNGSAAIDADCSSTVDSHDHDFAGR